MTAPKKDYKQKAKELQRQLGYVEECYLAIIHLHINQVQGMEEISSTLDKVAEIFSRLIKELLKIQEDQIKLTKEHKRLLLILKSK